MWFELPGHRTFLQGLSETHGEILITRSSLNDKPTDSFRLLKAKPGWVRIGLCLFTAQMMCLRLQSPSAALRLHNEQLCHSRREKANRRKRSRWSRLRPLQTPLPVLNLCGARRVQARRWCWLQTVPLLLTVQKTHINMDEMHSLGIYKCEDGLI